MIEFKYLNVSENGIAFEPTTGECFQLNASGVFILKRLQENQSVDAIASNLAREFGVKEDQALTDVFEFLSQTSIMGFRV